MSSESLPSTVFENFDEHLAFSIPPASPSSCTLAQDSLAISEVAAGEETDQGTLAERPPSFNSIVDPEGVLRHALASELFETQWTAPTDLETDSSTIAADISLNDFGWTGQSSTSQEYRDELVGDRSARCERSFRPSVTIPSCQYPGEYSGFNLQVPRVHSGPSLPAFHQGAGEYLCGSTSSRCPHEKSLPPMSPAETISKILHQDFQCSLN